MLARAHAVRCDVLRSGAPPSLYRCDVLATSLRPHTHTRSAHRRGCSGGAVHATRRAVLWACGAHRPSPGDEPRFSRLHLARRRGSLPSVRAGDWVCARRRCRAKRGEAEAGKAPTGTLTCMRTEGSGRTGAAARHHAASMVAVWSLGSLGEVDFRGSTFFEEEEGSTLSLTL